jgi:hypothetical protein
MATKKQVGLRRSNLEIGNCGSAFNLGNKDSAGPAAELWPLLSSLLLLVVVVRVLTWVFDFWFFCFILLYLDKKI